MPIGSYADWDECIEAQRKKGHTLEEAKRICGKLEQMVKEGKRAS
jgi:hypothetical protein